MKPESRVLIFGYLHSNLHKKVVYLLRGLGLRRTQSNQKARIFKRRSTFLQTPTKKAWMIILTTQDDLTPAIPPSQWSLIALPNREVSSSSGQILITSNPWRSSYSTGPELSIQIAGCASIELPAWCHNRCRVLPSAPLITFQARPYSSSPIIPPVKDIISSKETWNCWFRVPTL